MTPQQLFNDKTKPRYLEALNEALIKHPGYKLGMKFTDITLRDQKVVLLVSPMGILEIEDAKKAFDDLATILTISGSTLEYEIVEADVAVQ